MNPTAILILRNLLQAAADVSPGDDAAANPKTTVRRPFSPIPTPAKPFDSTMALTIIVLLTALFFLGFFSFYIRRYAAADDHHQNPSPPSSFAAAQRLPTNRKGGLDIAAVKSLPLVAYGGPAKFPQMIAVDDCPICLTRFEEGETVKVIPYCGHVFHPECVDTWLETHVTCPLCRSAEMFRRVDEVCLDVTRGEIGEERSTVRDCDTCQEGVRRGCGSCSNNNLAHSAVLQRSNSF